MWHVCLEGLKDVASLCYGWRAEADVAWEGRSRFHPGVWGTLLHWYNQMAMFLCALLDGHERFIGRCPLSHQHWIETTLMAVGKCSWLGFCYTASKDLLPICFMPLSWQPSNCYSLNC